MKKLLPFIALIILSGCSNRAPKARENKQMQTIHEFIGYLENNDTKGARTILQLNDTTRFDRDYVNIEIGQIDSAWRILQQNDIDDSTWVSDTATMDGDLNFFITVCLKENTGNPYSKFMFRFFFSLDGSDTTLTYFDFYPPEPQKHRTAAKNNPMQLIHQFIGYLKNNDLKGALAMLPVQDTNSDQGIENYNHAVDQVDSAWIALQQADIADDSFWVSDTIRTNGDLNLILEVPLKKDVGNPHLASAFRFMFFLVSSDTLLVTFDYTHTPFNFNEAEISTQNKQMQTIHQVIKYLKNKDTKSILAMLQGRDSKHYKNKTFYNYEISQIDSAFLALQQNDVADYSFWESDTIRTDGDLNLIFVGPLKKDIGNPHPKSALCFIFLLVNSDTLFYGFGYKQSNLSNTETISSNGPMQLIHQFIGYLKKNDLKSAKAMFRIKDTRTTSHRRFINDEMIQMNHARRALQQNDTLADSLWGSGMVTIDGVPYLCIIGMTEKDFDKPGQPSFRFLFYVNNSDTLLDFFEYGLPHPIL